MNHILELDQVTKRYGTQRALENITFTIDEPGIYCLLGRNGAGKTTLFKSIAGYQNVTEGTIQIDGRRISTASLDPDVRYVENAAQQFNLPVQKLLEVAAEVSMDFDAAFAAEMMEHFELDGRKRYHHLSLGMKTMVSTILSLSSSKSVILLDEPVLGLDVIMRNQFYDLLRESFQKSPRIIMVSTHLIDEIADTIEKLLILEQGRLCFFDTLSSVKEKAFSVSGLKDDVEPAIRDMHVIRRESQGILERVYLFDRPPASSASLIVQPLSLQDFFLQVVKRQGGEKE